jgi:TonB family protein
VVIVDIAETGGGLRPAWAAGLSLALHAALAVLGCALALGGWIGGAGLQGTGFEVGTGSELRIAGIIRLSAGDGADRRVRYPETARKQGLVGHVLLRFHLDEKGGMSQLHVVQAEPPGVFEKAALAAVREWRFAPAERNGVPVAYWAELPMPFVLR